MRSDFLHLPVPLGRLLLERTPGIGRGLEFNPWCNSQVYKHPTDVRSLPRMLNDWCPLLSWVDAVFTCPVCLAWGVLWASAWIHNRNVSASGGFRSRFSNTSCYYLPPSLLPVMWAESAVEWMTVETELYIWDVAIQFAWADARLVPWPAPPLPALYSAPLCSGNRYLPGCWSESPHHDYMNIKIYTAASSACSFLLL